MNLGRAGVLALMLTLGGRAHARPQHDPLVALAPHAEARIARRAHLARLGPARFQADGAPIDEANPQPFDLIAVVADENAQRVQIRTEMDDARVLVWVERADLATVIGRQVALLDATTGRRGAVARPGALVVTVGPGPDAAAREVTISDDEVSASGVVPATALATTYDRKSVASKPRHLLASGTIVRAEPRDDGRAIATARADVNVRAIGKAKDGWIEVEIDREMIYARGFAPAAAVTASDLLGLGGLGTMGYGMSDTDRILVPKGTCLYATPGGPVVGVTTTTRERYAQSAPDDGEPGVSRWRTVAVGTAWGITWPTVRISPRHPDRAAPGCER
ncbi:MAG: hypothetical protein K8W52_46465 [Deltaproteobacteria bacterium]|nr:hypothetical protein [Deltaproteobacteria bacterium]